MFYFFQTELEQLYSCFSPAFTLRDLLTRNWLRSSGVFPIRKKIEQKAATLKKIINRLMTSELSKIEKEQIRSVATLLPNNCMKKFPSWYFGTYNTIRAKPEGVKGNYYALYILYLPACAQFVIFLSSTPPLAFPLNTWLRHSQQRRISG